MSRLVWTKQEFSAGLDHGALYFRDGEAIPWNGLIQVDETTSERNSSVRYIDGQRVVNRLVDDAFSASIDCFTYPERLDRRGQIFNMSYRTQKGSGYETHLIYNALARIGQKKYVFKESTSLKLDVVTRPRDMPMFRKPSAHIIVDSALTYPPALAAFEEILYGNEAYSPRFPEPEELAALFDLNSLFRVVDNGDGTATLTAPEEFFTWYNSTQGVVEWPYVNEVDEDTVRVRNF